MVNYQHLRPGNWIYPTGRSKYVVVTGLLLGMMEKNEDFCKEFEGIELTGELLEAAGGYFNPAIGHYIFNWGRNGVYFVRYNEEYKAFALQLGKGQYKILSTLDHFQNLYLFLTGHELPLPESAKIIPQTLEK